VPAAPPQTPIPPPPPPERPAFVVVLDPGHGGADNGAKGAEGIVEKDIALTLARLVRIQLLQQGLHAVMTREADEDPSFDDRATLANSQRSALYVSFHVSSTGKVGSVRTYYYVFSAAVPVAPADVSKISATEPIRPRAAVHLIPWERAQEGFADASHRFADVIQGEVVKNFPSSPSTSSGVPLRDLRSVAAPAVAVELSSVTVPDHRALEAMYAPLATSIARGIIAYHSAANAGLH